MTTSDIHVAMMNLLWPRLGLPVQNFYDYWSGAHTQISSRLPGIHQYFQHHLDPELGKGFPGYEALTPSATIGFFGDAEITFATTDDLADFAASLSPLMHDEQNVFDKTISYQALGAHTATLKDETGNESPNGDLGSITKFMLYVQKSDALSIADFRFSLVEQIAVLLASSPDVVKVRYRCVEFYDNDAVTLLAPNVVNYEAPADQFEACIELAFLDPMAQRRYANSAVKKSVTSALVELTRGVMVHRAVSTFTVYNHGRITTAGLRTPQMAAQIDANGAVNQESDETIALMLNEHIFRKRL